MRQLNQDWLSPLAVLLILSTIGCTGIGEKKPTKTFAQRMPWSNSKDKAPEPYPNPVKLAATWSPDTLVQTGRTPTRGFGGRLYFFDEKSRTVPVEGTLVVHGFDDKVENPHDASKRFEFTPEQFTRHFSQTDLGASYSVWIPWDAVGGEPRRISLVASFKPSSEDAAPVQGVPAVVVLPGHSSTLDDTAAAELKFSPQYLEYKRATASLNTRASGLTTTTIQRRRSHTNPDARDAAPTVSDVRSMIADATATPSGEIRMVTRPNQSEVQAASATLPAQR